MANQTNRMNQDDSRTADRSINDRSNRYARQVQYSKIGRAGQDRVFESRVAVLGCGALGSVASELLARSGVGYLRLIDRDLVEWTNLQRQSLYDESDAENSRSKSEAASIHLSRINSDITIDPIVADIVPSNIESLLDDIDLVIDGSDNFAIRFLLNDWSLKTATPWVHGGCIGTSGQVRLFTGQGRACFRCLVPEAPPASAVDTCDTAGVLAPATHVIASLQAMAAIQFLSGHNDAVDQLRHKCRFVEPSFSIHSARRPTSDKTALHATNENSNTWTANSANPWNPLR